MEDKSQTFRRYFAISEAITAQLGFEGPMKEFIRRVYSASGGRGDPDMFKASWLRLGGRVQPAQANDRNAKYGDVYVFPRDIPNPQGITVRFSKEDDWAKYKLNPAGQPLLILPYTMGKGSVEKVVGHELGHNATYHAQRTDRSGGQYTFGGKIRDNSVVNRGASTDQKTLAQKLTYALSKKEKDAYGREVVNAYRSAFPGKPFVFGNLLKLYSGPVAAVIDMYLMALRNQDPKSLHQALAAKFTPKLPVSSKDSRAVAMLIQQAKLFARDLTVTIERENKQGQQPVAQAKVAAPVATPQQQAPPPQAKPAADGFSDFFNAMSVKPTTWGYGQ